jgi:hypothetical protein
MKDILILTADQNAELLIKALLEKIPAIENIPAIDYEIIRHPGHDSGVAKNAVEFVRPFINDCRFLMVLFDYEGSGKESLPKNILESEIEDTLNKNGWQQRNVCITFYPELESWLWVNHRHLHTILNWHNQETVYEWLADNGFKFQDGKPARPKEAIEFVLRKQNIPRSSSVYASLAQKASYRQCMDQSFVKFLSAIKLWFAK